MKKTCSRITGLMLLCMLFITISPQAKAQDADVSYSAEGVSYQTFYDQLAPYGQWIDDPQYGNVFVPNVEPGFRPYATDGYWAMTDNGNMWMSDAPWAWACYHYGRWTYNSYYGWVWVPGYKWAPAWVSWRSGNGVYGWAPMSPGYKVGGEFAYPDNYWTFVSPEYLYNPHVYNYYYGEPGIYIGRTTYLNETYAEGGTHYYYGPRREVIENETHRPVEVYHVSNARSAGSYSAGSGHSVSIYRPAMNRASAGTARPANVMPASRPVGRPEQVSPNHATSQPAFRQEHNQPQPQRQEPQRQPQQQREPQQQPMQQPQRQPQQQPQREPQQQPMQQPQRQPQQQPMQQPQRQPQQQPQREPQQQPMQQPQRQPQQQPMQQPQRQPQQQQRQPQQQPQQQQRPQQQMQQQQRPQQQPQQRPQQQQQRPQQQRPQEEKRK